MGIYELNFSFKMLLSEYLGGKTSFHSCAADADSCAADVYRSALIPRIYARTCRHTNTDVETALHTHETQRCKQINISLF